MVNPPSADAGRLSFSSNLEKFIFSKYSKPVSGVSSSNSFHAIVFLERSTALRKVMEPEKLPSELEGPSSIGSSTTMESGV